MTCHGPQPSTCLQRVCGIRRACGDRARGGHLMSKYNKSISLVDPAKLTLLDSFAVLSPYDYLVSALSTQTLVP